MRYVVMHVDWNVGLHGTQLQYTVFEMAAVLLDETLRSVDTFRFILERQSGYVRSEKHFGEGRVLVGDEKEGWTAFAAWYSRQDLLLVWDKSIREVLGHYDREQGGGQFSPRWVSLHQLFDKMTRNIPKEGDKLSDAMKMLELRCDAARLGSTLYYAQVMVRMFRKLYGLGRKEMGARFVHGLLDGDYFYLSQHDYFPRQKDRAVRERNQRMKEMIEAAGFKGGASGDVVTVEALDTRWEFNIMEVSPRLRYVTASFYRGVRQCRTSYGREAGWEDKLEDILRIIAEKDRSFSRGVGCQELTELVERIAQKTVGCAGTEQA